ncbi:MAG: hypothetical protein IJS32_06225, partial [Kiritimatiellae bacterium]|nr:hypothetical protein [Kiritimatiellia bacterium]
FANVWQNQGIFAKHWQNGMVGQAVPASRTNGLRFTSVDVETNGTVALSLAWEEDGDADIFVCAVPHDPGVRVFTWTNDENQVVTVTNTVWTMAGPNLSGFDNDWEWRGTATVTNGEGLFVDTGIPDYLGVMRFYAAAEANDTDGDGWNDGWERFVFHTDPTVPNNGNPDPSGTNETTNVFWFVTTTNEFDDQYWMGTCTSNAPAQRVVTESVSTAAPTTNSVVYDVTITGFVDDNIKVDNHDVDWRRNVHEFDHRNITNEINDLQSGQFSLELWDYPLADYAGPNEARFGDTNGVPFRVEWTWAVPMEFRLEHITTNGAPLVVNPSGTRPNREITCVATVLPTNIPDTDIHWEVSGAGMDFVGGTNWGREVHLAATRPGDWVAIVTVSNSTLRPARLRGTVLEKKDVNVYLHIVRDNDGQNPAMTVAHFDELLTVANQIWEQAAVEFHRASSVMYIDKTDWQVISTTDNLAEYHEMQSTNSNTGGIEIYCIQRFENNRYNALTSIRTNAMGGTTLTTNATARTLAHELGHVCGLLDIYTNRVSNGVTNELPSTLPANKNWIPRDWCEEAPLGGYGEVPQTEIIHRLLMYGVGVTRAVDIPAGKITGLNTAGATNSISVGLWNMKTRNPKHW